MLKEAVTAPEAWQLTRGIEITCGDPKLSSIGYALDHLRSQGTFQAEFVKTWHQGELGELAQELTTGRSAAKNLLRATAVAFAYGLLISVQDPEADADVRRATSVAVAISDRESDLLTTLEARNLGILVVQESDVGQQDCLVTCVLRTLGQGDPAVLRPSVAEGGFQVRLDHFAGLTFRPDSTVIKPNGSVTRGADNGQVVADEDDRAAIVSHLLHLIEALVPERRIAHGEYLVHQEDLLLQVGGDRKT